MKHRIHRRPGCGQTRGVGAEELVPELVGIFV
jgi:hypothetical protein